MKRYKITTYDKGCWAFKEGAWVDCGETIMYANSITLPFKLLFAMLFDYYKVEEVEK